MKQLLTRIDDDLHRRLKARAALERRSVNDLVTELLRTAVGGERALLGRRIERSGLRVYPPAPPAPPPRDRVLRANRGAGQAVSEALAAERDGR